MDIASQLKNKKNRPFITELGIANRVVQPLNYSEPFGTILMPGLPFVFLSGTSLAIVEEVF